MKSYKRKSSSGIEIIILGIIIYFAKDIISFGKSENYIKIIYIFIAAAVIAIAIAIAASIFTKAKKAIKKANKKSK